MEMSYQFEDYLDSYGVSCRDYTIYLDKLYLGNNFSYQHFIDALSGDQIDYIRSIDWQLEDAITLMGIGRHSLVYLKTCGNDLTDHLRGL